MGTLAIYLAGILTAAFVISAARCCPRIISFSVNQHTGARYLIVRLPGRSAVYAVAAVATSALLTISLFLAIATIAY